MHRYLFAFESYVVFAGINEFVMECFAEPFRQGIRRFKPAGVGSLLKRWIAIFGEFEFPPLLKER